MNVRKYKQNQLSHQDLVTGQIVGIEFSSGVRKFVQRTSVNSYICANLEADSGGEKVVGLSIPHLIESCVGIKEIVLFDTSLELKEWL